MAVGNGKLIKIKVAMAFLNTKAKQQQHIEFLLCYLREISQMGYLYAMNAITLVV